MVCVECCIRCHFKNCSAPKTMEGESNDDYMNFVFINLYVHEHKGDQELTIAMIQRRKSGKRGEGVDVDHLTYAQPPILPL